MRIDYIVDCDILEDGHPVKWANIPVSWEEDDGVMPTAREFIDHVRDVYHEHSQWSHLAHLPEAVKVRIIGVFKL